MVCGSEIFRVSKRLSVRRGGKRYVDAQRSHPHAAPTRSFPEETHASQRRYEKYRGYQTARRTHDPALKSISSGVCDLVGHECTTGKRNPNNPCASCEFRRLAVAPCRELRQERHPGKSQI